MKIGAENHALNMENFGRYLSAVDVVAQNKAAEQKSKQDMIKDDLQSANAEKQAGIQNITNAANAFIGTQAAGKTGNLYTDTATKTAFKNAGVEMGVSTDWLMQNNPLFKR